jgi:RNA polymerase sigma factor (sigma-70 family)
VQETFTRALTKLTTLRDTSQFRPWVLQIARNAAIDDLRARTVVRLESIEEDHRSLAAVEHGPETMAEARELATVVRAGVATLSPRDAAAVSMVAHLGFGPDEVADALGITPGNASVVLHRARARLRRAMATGHECIDEACGSMHERQHLSA